MSEPLPSLNALRAFEAVARCLSFRKAAESLNVSHSALSQHVRQLETSLGCLLVDRSRAQISLTEAGLRYAEEVGAAFRMLEAATERLRPREEGRAFTLNLPTSLATRWLAPRLANFQEAHPDLELRISTPTRDIDFDREDIDAAIVQDGRGRGELVREPILGNRLNLVCSPALLEAHPHLKPRDLGRTVPLLVVDESNRPEDWHVWCQSQGLELPEKPRQMVFKSSLPALQAALNGLGVAMGHAPLVEDDLEAGRLVLPFPKASVSRDSYEFICPPRALRRKAVREFLAWIREES